MPTRDSGCVSGSMSRASAAAPNDSSDFSKRREDELIRIFLPPLQSGFFAVHSQAEIIFISRCNLRCPESTLSTLRKTQHHVNVIVEASSGYECGHVGRHLLTR